MYPTSDTMQAAAHPIFAALEAPQLDDALRYLHLTEYPREQMIFHAGDPASTIFLLLRGMVKISYGNPRGEEKIVSIFQDGDLFGDLFIGSYRFRIGTAVTLTSVTVGRLQYDHFVTLVERYPRLGLTFSQHLADRQRETLARTHVLMHMDAQTRLIGTLHNLAHHHCCTQQGWFIVPDCLSQDDIANMANLNRSTASMLINRLRREGILGGTGRTLTVNRAAVKELLTQAGLEILA